MTTSIITRVFQTYLEQPRWVGWHIDDDQKVPLIGTSQRRASVDKPDTWRPFAECPDDRRGIVFNGDGLGGVDLDGCRDPDTGEYLLTGRANSSMISAVMLKSVHLAPASKSLLPALQPNWPTTCGRWWVSR